MTLKRTLTATAVSLAMVASQTAPAFAYTDVNAPQNPTIETGIAAGEAAGQAAGGGGLGLGLAGALVAGVIAAAFVEGTGQKGPDQNTPRTPAPPTATTTATATTTSSQ